MTLNSWPIDKLTEPLIVIVRFDSYLVLSANEMFSCQMQTRICTCPGSLASSLESSIKRNQLAGASCKSCGGRFLVDGIGPLSRSMLGTVGLEVTNSINCELSWKTVKGKRSRKSVARNNGRVALGNKSPKRVGDFSGSDSDKVCNFLS